MRAVCGKRGSRSLEVGARYLQGKQGLAGTSRSGHIKTHLSQKSYKLQSFGLLEEYVDFELHRSRQPKTASFDFHEPATIMLIKFQAFRTLGSSDVSSLMHQP